MNDNNYFSIPDEAIILDSDLDLNPLELSIKAIRVAIQDKQLDKQVKIKDSFFAINNIKVNGFHTQIVIGSFMENEIKIKTSQILNKGKSTQLILASIVDEENNIVYFPGLITAESFKDLILKQNSNSYISIPIEEFEGGIDRFFDYVCFLDKESIKSLVLNLESQGLLSEDMNFKQLKSFFVFVSLAVISSFAVGNIRQSRLLFNTANIYGTEFIIADNTRSGNYKDQYKICLLSPKFNKIKNSSAAIKNLSVNKPIILFGTPLAEIKIVKNDNLVWNKIASSDEKITNYLRWPIDPIERNNIYKLILRPFGSPNWNSQEIIFTARKDSFKNIDKIIETLGESPSKWIKVIRRNIKEDRNLSISLLLSDKRPYSRILDIAEKKLIKGVKCK